MGEVIEFRPKVRRADGALGALQADVAAVEAVAGGTRAVLQAAEPLFERLSRDFGFTVMRRGLPDDPSALVAALALLSQCATSLAVEFGVGRPFANVGVYFTSDLLAWFDDGYGEETALSVPLTVTARELTAFIRAHVVGRRKGA